MAKSKKHHHKRPRLITSTLFFLLWGWVLILTCTAPIRLLIGRLLGISLVCLALWLGIGTIIHTSSSLLTIVQVRKIEHQRQEISVLTQKTAVWLEKHSTSREALLLSARLAKTLGNNLDANIYLKRLALVDPNHPEVILFSH